MLRRRNAPAHVPGILSLPLLHVEHASIRQYAAGMVWRCLVHSINLSLLCTTVLALFTATVLTNLRAAAFLRATSNW